MKEGFYNIFQSRNYGILFLIPVIGFVFTTSCGGSGATISTAPNDARQVAQEDTTDALSENQNTDEADSLAQYQEELEQLYIEELEERYQGRANSITTYYNNAQRFFYMRNYQAALYHINKAAEIHETSDILALRGSIYLALGSKQKFTENWRMALEMDKEVPIPNLDFIINELKAQGLINQNYQPGN